MGISGMLNRMVSYTLHTRGIMDHRIYYVHLSIRYANMMVTYTYTSEGIPDMYSIAEMFIAGHVTMATIVQEEP